jgi:uncharacterized peroxidase-related enzyme
MAFITTVTEDAATGLLRDLYDAELAGQGYIANYTQLLSARPEVYAAWRALIGAIRSHMHLRRYELVTFAAAAALRCSYCLLAHGAVLRKNFFSAAEVAAIATDYRTAGLPAEDVAIMAFAQKVTLAAHTVTQGDVDSLRAYGLTDAEILDIVLATAARNFFSKTLDALAAEPDAVYHDLEPELQAALAQGRPFEAHSHIVPPVPAPP